MLCVDSQDLANILITTNVETSSNILNFKKLFKKITNKQKIGGIQLFPRTAEDAINCRNSFAKSLYSRLFGWIVKTLNYHIDSQEIR